MPCVVYDVAGSFTWTWPDGVDKAFVSCLGGSAGGGHGTHTRGAGAGGGGAFAAGVVSKTDPTANIVVGAAGTGGATTGADGTNGGGTHFTQSSTSTEEVEADGRKGPSGATGGAGGSTAASTGSIKYAGGNGGSRDSGDDGGGGGAAACDTSAGESGQDGSAGGLGGSVCPNTGHSGGGGGNGGHDGTNGANGTAGGGGGGGTDGAGGNGIGGYVIICWTAPTPDGYCLPRQCWWPNCGYYGGYNCFYYGYYPAKPPHYYSYHYGTNSVGTSCCSIGIPSNLFASLTSDCPALDGIVIPIVYESTDLGGTAIWHGEISICPGFNLILYYYCQSGGSSIYALVLSNSDGSCWVGNGIGRSSLLIASCDPFIGVAVNRDFYNPSFGCTACGCNLAIAGKHVSFILTE